MNDLQTWLAFLYNNRAYGLFGGQQYVNATLDGTATVPWAAKVGSVYTLQQDVALNNLTLTGAGVQLDVNGYGLYGAGTLTTLGGAIIHANGAAGATTTPGAARAFGTLAGSFAGGQGGAAGAGNPSPAAGGWMFGGPGASGGAGSGGGAGAVGANSFVPSNYQGSLYVYTPHLLGSVRGLAGYAIASGGYQMQLAAVAGGVGGSGGGGSAGGNGGGGGAGGGVVGIVFRNIVLANASDIQAKGGNGGNAAGGGNGGGGGPGGGGLVLLYYVSLIVSSGAFSNATNTPPGAAGSGAGTGSAGSAGFNGNMIAVALS